MPDFSKRLVSGIIAGALALTALLTLTPSVLTYVLWGIATVAWGEWVYLSPMGLTSYNTKGKWLWIFLGSVALGSLICVQLPYLFWVIGWLGVIFGTCAMWRKTRLLSIPPTQFYLAHVLFLGGGGIYITCLFLPVVMMLQHPELPSPTILLLKYLILIFAGDTAGYVCGHTMGHTPLSPALSPKKTWEGVIGSLGISVVTFLILFWKQQPPGILAGLGMVVGFCALGGDLFESAIKRGLGVKDSGNILPGHGGILDRVDSMFFSAAVFYLLIEYAVIRG